jgi:hypothetical protein
MARRRKHPSITSFTKENPVRGFRKLKLAMSMLAATSALVAAPAAFSSTSVSAGAAVRAAVPAAGPVPAPVESSCQMGNGSQHVVEVFFDNVHFFRDNPNVQSDIEQIPALENFITSNGTFLSNNHTPLIAHTADDSITDYTGLYGDRQGMGIANDFEVYNATHTNVNSAASFAYWTVPIDYTGTAGTDTMPNQPYSATVPPTSAQVNGQAAQDPAPWVPFTRAGCDTGAVSTANMVLENVSPDIANVYGASSPEQAQVNADGPATGYHDQEVADYVGLTVHCAQGSSFCATAQATKFGQTTPSSTATTDSLPTEPGGYTGFQQLSGHKYLQPQIANVIAAHTGASSTANLTDGDGYQVTNSAGNLVDLFGNEMDGDYVTGPGFPGFGGITAAQSLAYTADLQDSGVPITYAYISDLHEKKYYPSNYVPASGTGAPPTCTTAGANTGYGLGPADPCYKYNAEQYNAAFATFFARLAAEGINQSNTTFLFSADEGDHFNGANVGRAITPSCTGTADTSSYTCSYPTGSVGEVDTSLHSLLTQQTGDSTPFYVEPQAAAIYPTGTPTATAVRQLERDTGSVTVNDPFNGNPNTPVANYMADATEEQLLHFTNADPNRTPAFTVFPQSEVYFNAGESDSCSSGVTPANANTKCASLNSEYLWNHGYYQQEIDSTWEGMVGPDVKNLGLNGNGAGAGPSSAGPNSGGPALVSSEVNPGIWMDHTDARPTLLALVGLKDDYISDGRVLTELMVTPPATTQDPTFLPLATCYKQLNSSVGEFGSETLEADTQALETGSTSSDGTYNSFSSQLSSLGTQRDSLATTIKDELNNAEFNGIALPPSASSDVTQCNTILTEAAALLGNPSNGTPESPLPILLPALGILLVGLVFFLRRRRNAHVSVLS